MLLQITEPDSPSSLFSIGIDLGTTHTVVSYIDGEGTPQSLTIDGSPLLPSIVAIHSSKIFVGQNASQKENAFRSTKRLFHRPENVIEDTTETPLSIATKILTYVKEKTEEALQKPITHAVITVPAYFDEPARQATKKAAENAGFHVLRLISEPTAAALAYGLEHSAQGVYAIYDLGGGTFDFSLLNLQDGVFQVLATGGDIHLGGDDLDTAICEFWGKGATSQENLSNLRVLARHAKEVLSAQDIFEKQGYHLTKEKLKHLSASLIQRTLSICTHVLKDAKMKVKDIQGTVLVGGSTRLLAVQEAVEAFFGKPPLRDINPDEVVSHGAALHAHALTHDNDLLLLDVIPLSLGIETMGGVFETIIPRNTPLPAHMAQDFTTYVDGQTALHIRIFQGEREMVADCRFLGDFILSGIPPQKAGIPRIRVSFQLDVSGLLRVSAKEQTSGLFKDLEVSHALNLSQEDVTRILKESLDHAEEDMHQRLLEQEKLASLMLLEEIDKALNEVGLDKAPCELCEKKEDLKTALQSEDRHQIKTCRDALSELCEPLANKRIKKAIEERLSPHVS